MKNKVKKGIQLFFLIAFCLLLGFGATYVYYNRHYVMIERAEAEGAHSEEMLKEQQFITIDKRDYGQFSTLFEAYQELYNDHLNTVKPKELIDGAIAGMTGATKDRYTSYTAIDSTTKTAKDSLSSSYKGIGAEVSLIDGYPVIINPYKNAPAYNAGVLPYDRILKVNGEDVVGMDLSTVTSKVKGKEGTEVVLTLQRGNLEPFELSIIRSEITVQTVFYDIVKQDEKTIGTIEIASFSEQTAEEFEIALEEVEKQKIEGLVIDVRDNGGGYLDAVQMISSQLLPIGTPVLKIEDKNGNRNTIRTTNLIKDKKEYPIAVLVNGASASASEVFAAALKESGSYKIVGSQTFGKGTVQELRILDDESELKITVAKWLTPKGTWVHEEGIEPDVVVEEPFVYKIPGLYLEEENSYKVGDVSEQVRYMQEILSFMDYELASTNGYFDEATEEALLQYQTEKEIKATGELDHDTVFALNQSLIQLKNDPNYDEQMKKAIQLVSE